MKNLLSFLIALCLAACAPQVAPPTSCRSVPLELPETKQCDDVSAKPVALTRYGPKNPAGKEPLLRWSVVPRAVYYELEFTAAPPENPNGVQLSARSLFSTRAIYTNGCYADLRAAASETLYWRVRALDYGGEAIGVFSDAQEIHLNAAAASIPRPIAAAADDRGGLPLYPVYKWIPLRAAAAYEVELLNRPPERENDTQPSSYRIWSKITADSSACYDDCARLLTPGVYYWRVRGIDANGNTIGRYSAAVAYTVDTPRPRVFAAAFGDSITHGGGAISYSPADLEYNYETYLDFPALNLGRSGDTAATSAERFDRDVLPFLPKNLLILCGANSLRAGTSAQTIIRNLAAIRAKCLANGIRPIFLTLLPLHPGNIRRAFGTETAGNWKNELRLVNEFIRRQPYALDLEPYFTDENGLLAVQYAIDGLHPDIAGKKRLAAIINAHKSLLAP